MVYLHYSKACGKDTKLWNFRSRESLSFYILRGGKICSKRCLRSRWARESAELRPYRCHACSMTSRTSQFPISPLWVRSKKRVILLADSWLENNNGTPLQYSCLENPMDGGAWWAVVHGVTKSRTRLSDFTFTFHFHALEKEMATHSSVLAWGIPGTAEPGGLPSMGSHRVGHDWHDLAAAAGFQWTGPCQPRWSSMAQSGWLSIFTNDRKEACLWKLSITTPERHGNMLIPRIRIQKDCGDLNQQSR